ncbi:hypothetical protein D3C87_2088960 [compost metagenome]
MMPILIRKLFTRPRRCRMMIQAKVRARKLSQSVMKRTTPIHWAKRELTLTIR